MIEYSIYTICKGGCPYYSAVYNSLEECREALFSIISYHKKHNHLYYVDNNFFKNEFPYIDRCYYYSIHSREVFEWQNIDDLKLKNSNVKNNIIYFQKYVDNF